MRSGLARALTLLVSLVASVVLLELGLRVATPETFGQRPFPDIPFISLDPVFGWTNLPDVDSARSFEMDVPIGTNALGFRGPELARDKPAGAFESSAWVTRARSAGGARRTIPRATSASTTTRPSWRRCCASVASRTSRW